jgi:hypothetical protein
MYGWRLILLAAICWCIGCSDETRTKQVPAVESTPATQVATGKIENSITIDTTGCLTIEAFDKTASAPASSVPGCIDLDRGVRVIGPLEVKTVKIGGSDFTYAKIEVPGKGERWTMLVHLETGRDEYRRTLKKLLDK